MAARITRAKKKIATARIPYRVPSAAELPERIDAVLGVVHLMFTTGHTAPDGPELTRTDLTGRALDLARMLHTLLPDDPDVTGLLALILLTDARRAGRLDADGRLVLLRDQDRSRWDRAAIAEGADAGAGRRSPPVRRAATRCRRRSRPSTPRRRAGTTTDWAELVGLYGVLRRAWPSPVVALNEAVAIGFAPGRRPGWPRSTPLADEPLLATYAYLPVARADFLVQLGRPRRGPGGLRGGAAADRERGRAGVPRIERRLRVDLLAVAAYL